MDKIEINKGKEITKQFPGGIFEEVKILRDSVNLLIELIDYDSLKEKEKEVHKKFKKYLKKCDK